MAKANYVGVSGLKLTPNNLRKMHKHQGTIIKPSTGGEMEIFVSPIKARKMMNAMKKGKGVKLVMTPAEMEHTMKHGKGVMLPSRKIFTPPKEGMPIIAKKGVIAHKSVIDAVNSGNDTFQVVRNDPVAPLPTPTPKRRGRKKNAEVDLGEDNILTRQGLVVVVCATSRMWVVPSSVVSTR
jgi:hypothetical protein